jgi:oligopeptide/dipeptide ABC transporter ATP-binding protein
MYAGYIVEQAPVMDLYKRPAHPYTLGLLQSMPSADARNQDRLASIEGTPPDLREQFDSCPFAPRCPHVVEKCLSENPPLMTIHESHSSACWRGEEIRSESNPQAVT